MDKEEVKQNLYSSLKELGLSEAEINLYSISLVMGNASISEIAKHLGISRPNVYKVIAGLEKHGLTQFTQHNKYSRKFSVESPSVVLEKLREKREKMSQLDHSLVSALPDLLTLYHQEESSTKIKVLQGREQYLKAFNEILEQEKKEIQYFGSAEDFVNFISPAAEADWIKRRMKKGIVIKSLLLPSETALAFSSNDAKEMRETKILKGAWPFVTSFQLFSNKVIIWQPKAPLAILIEDKFIVEMLKSIFDKLWEIQN
jgi:sugar-specific transcriptional regulator TrmB